MALPPRRGTASAVPSRPAGRAAQTQGSQINTSHRGEDGRNRSLVEQQKAADRAALKGSSDVRMPFRFRVPAGQEASFIVLDESPDFFRYEHATKDQQGKWGSTFHPCIAEVDDCPVCRVTGTPGYYAMYFTVIDLRPYTDSKGNQIDFSRKLLVVKPAQHKKFLRAYTRLQQEYGTMRGAIFDVARDSSTDAAIGNDISLSNDEPLTEDELHEYVRYWTDKDGKEQQEDCFTVFDYDALFPAVTREQLERAVGASPTPGSAAYNRQSLPSAPARGTARRGRPAQEQQQEEESGDWDEEEAVPTPAPRGRRAAQATAKEPPPWDADDPPAASPRKVVRTPPAPAGKPAALPAPARRVPPARR